MSYEQNLIAGYEADYRTCHDALDRVGIAPGDSLSRRVILATAEIEALRVRLSRYTVVLREPQDDDHDSL